MSYRWQPTAGTFTEGDLDAAGLAQSFDSQPAAERAPSNAWSE